ncbi:hypothetical protein ACPV5U_24430 [Vibrio mediterranei]
MFSNSTSRFILTTLLIWPLTSTASVTDVKQKSPNNRYGQVSDNYNATTTEPGYQTSSKGEAYTPKIKLDNATGDISSVTGMPRIDLSRAIGDISSTSGINNTIRDNLNANTSTCGIKLINGPLPEFHVSKNQYHQSRNYSLSRPVSADCFEVVIRGRYTIYGTVTHFITRFYTNNLTNKSIGSMSSGGGMLGSPRPVWNASITLHNNAITVNQWIANVYWTKVYIDSIYMY